MLIHIIRHTTPDIAPGTCYGQADIPLKTSFGDEKAELFRKLLPRYDALYSSPLSRCRRLAEDIKADDRAVDERLLEYNFGDWEQRRWDDIPRVESQAWMDDFVNTPAPNGESLLVMQSRVNCFFAELIVKNYKTVALVTHAGVQRLLYGHVLGTELTKIFRLRLDFGAVLELRYNHNRESSLIKHL